MKRTPLKQGRGFAASPAQRQHVKGRPCIVTGWTEGVDPAHLCARGRGGCDEPLCVVPLRRDVHRRFDDGRLDLLPYLIAAGLFDEIAHATVHYRGDLIGLASRLTGDRYVPEREAA